MATPVLNFNPQTFAQSNPFMQGMQTSLELPNTFAKAAFGPKMAAQDLYKQQLANREASAQAQYAPENALSGMQVNQLKVPFTKAQISHLEEETRLLPEQTRISLMNALAKQAEVEQSKKRFGPDYMAQKFMQTDFGKALLAKNPTLANQIANVIAGNARAAENEYMGGGDGMPSTNTGTQNTSLPGSLNNVNPSQVGAKPTGQMSSPATGQISPPAQGKMSTPTSQGNLAQFTPDQMAFAEDAVESIILAKTTPKAIQVQRYYANSADELLKETAADIPTITKFAGIQGQSKATLDDMLARFDIKTDPDFAKYFKFIHTTGPLIANDIKRGLGAAATDSERAIFENLVTHKFWEENAELAIQQLQGLTDSLYTVERVLNRTNAQTQHTLADQLKKGPIQFPTSDKLSAGNGTNGARVVVYRNGKAVSIPSNQLNDALKLPGVTRGP